VRVIDDGGGAGGQGFDAAGELAVEDLQRGVQGGGGVAGGDVFVEQVVCVAAFEEGLPEVVVWGRGLSLAWVPTGLGGFLIIWTQREAM